MKQYPLPLSRAIRTFLSLIAMATLFTACSRSGVERIDPNPTTSTQQINVFLSDAPSDFQHVFVDIQKVEIKVDLDRSHASDDLYGDDDADIDDTEEADQYGRWVTLNFAPQVMDVLALRNGIERLLGSAAVPTRVRKIRFTIGDQNRVIDGDGIDKRLTLINETENLLYLHVNTDDMDNTQPGSTDLRIDMDLARSVQPAGDEYVLRPQFRLFNLQNTGSVSGTVTPVAAGARVTITDGVGFESGAIPSDADGFFLIRGLRPGITYTISIDAPGYHTYEIRDVQIDRQVETQLGEINL
jgi:hypothetical protein